MVKRVFQEGVAYGKSTTISVPMLLNEVLCDIPTQTWDKVKKGGIQNYVDRKGWVGG